ncbi:MAG: HD-GYP domain-containing protein [Armatimonadetes bacterium]|nr:HD-GYP domain-containing protein [Armatimonadota bacterium]
MAVALVARTYLVPSLAPADAPFPGLAAVVAAGLAVLMVGLGGLFPLPLGHKIHLNIGITAAFATLLVFPPQQAILLTSAGTLAAQVIRWGRGSRLTPPTILFNLAQYLVTWSLAAEVYHRIQANPVTARPAVSWVPVVAAGVVYLLVNTWLVTTWAALRRRAWTWDLWVRALREAGSAYVSALSLGAAAAGMVTTRPLLVLMLVPALVMLRQMLVSMSGISVRQASAAFEAMVEFVEQGSAYMAEHSERVAWWAQRLARCVGLSEDEIETVAIAAKLHDLGAVTMPKSIEEKPGALSDDEWAIVRQHPAGGAEVIVGMPEMKQVAQCIQYHHERYDGTGYPEALQGEEIPLGARIIAVAEAFDAMVSIRPYRAALGREEALARISMNMGTQFDPRMVLALVELTRGQVDERRIGAVAWSAVAENKR